MSSENTTRRAFFSILIALLMVLSLFVGHAFADVVIDNGDSGTTSTGTWKVSGGINPYGANSLYARPSATYGWQLDSQPAGTYEVLMRWTSTDSRGTDIAVMIDHADGTDTRSVNQLANGGEWISLGTYSFTNAGGLVTITASSDLAPDGRFVSTCADAVRL